MARKGGKDRGVRERPKGTGKWWASCAAAALCSFFLSGCLEWSTDSQGNLKSAGLPGVPLWTAAQPSSISPHDALRAAELVADVNGTSPWLAELNKWREMAGLRPVGENAGLSAGSQEHARYLVANGPSDPEAFRNRGSTLGAGMHREASDGASYSEKGAEAARGGRLTPGVMQTADVAFGRDPIDDIDEWLVAPFHRLSLLAPWAEVAGYGSFGTYPRRVGALALRGLAHAGEVSEVEFPPDGSVIAIDAMRRPEWPNPLSVCVGYSLPVGLPVSLQLGDGRAAQLASYTLRDETQNRQLQSCGFDGDSYGNPNPAEQRAGRDGLNGFGALVVIPRYPLQIGHRYAVSIVARGKHYDWTFRIEGNPATAGAESAEAR